MHDLHKLQPNFPVTANDTLTVRIKYSGGEMSLAAKAPRAVGKELGR
jgi:hypothetical protein